MVGEVWEVQPYASPPIRICEKLPRFISNRSGMFRTALLHTSPPESVQPVQISWDDLVRKSA